MSLTSCALCHREALRDRWIGPLHGVFCDLCGCLYIPESAPAVGVSAEVPSPQGRDAHAHRSSGHRLPSRPLAVT